MPARFYAPDLDVDGTVVALPEEEARHLLRVLRLRIGDEVGVFDGRGVEVAARVASVDGGRVTLSILHRQPDTRRATVPLALAQSVLKGEAMDEVIRDCTMVGIEDFHPIISERTTVKSAVIAKGPERWRRLAIAAAKQSGRSRLPDIHPPTSITEWLHHGVSGQSFILLEPSATVPGSVTLRDLAGHPAPARATLLVGPEGGWAPAERDSALAVGCIPLSLGRLTLRADAVPLVATAALLAIWDEGMN